MTKSKSAYSVPTKLGKLEKHIIIVWVDNEAGVLARVVGLFSGRGYNIDSLTVAEVDKKNNLSRITIVTTGTLEVIDQIKLQLKKLIPVHKVADFLRGDKKIIYREMALFKIVSSIKRQENAKKLCKKYNLIILDKTNKSIVLQVTTVRREIDNLLEKLKKFGLVSVSRTGSVAMTRGAQTFR